MKQICVTSDSKIDLLFMRQAYAVICTNCRMPCKNEESMNTTFISIQVGKSYESAREALILNGNFVIAQLKEHDKQHATTLTDSPLVVALNKEVTICNFS